MKRILKKINLLLSTMLLSFSVIGCGIQYTRLSHDINKWDSNVIFNNQGLLKAIKKSELNSIVDEDSLTNFYENCFDNLDQKTDKELLAIHKIYPFIYFMKNDSSEKSKYSVYLPMLPIIKYAIINYELKTKNAKDEGLNTIKKIDQAIEIKYLLKDKDVNYQQVYLKNPEIGLFATGDIYHGDDKSIPNNALLLTKFLDSSEKTQSVPSVSSLLVFNIYSNKETPNNPYHSFLINQQFVVTISWF